MTRWICTGGGAFGVTFVAMFAYRTTYTTTCILRALTQAGGSTPKSTVVAMVTHLTRAWAVCGVLITSQLRTIPALLVTLVPVPSIHTTKRTSSVRDVTCTSHTVSVTLGT